MCLCASTFSNPVDKFNREVWHNRFYTHYGLFRRKGIPLFELYTNPDDEHVFIDRNNGLVVDGRICEVFTTLHY